MSSKYAQSTYLPISLIPLIPVGLVILTQGEIRYKSLYIQAKEWILKVLKDMPDSNGKKRFYIAGHSLGGALATGKQMQ